MKPPADRASSEPDSNRVLIIGGGLAGLACGCYLQMNGYETEILEAGANTGGLCTAWDRGPYVFDGCLRWVLGLHPGGAFHQIWSELGALAGQRIIEQSEIIRIEWADRRALSVPADLDQIEREFKRLAPEDAARVDGLLGAARCCASLEPPLDQPVELMSFLQKLRLGSRYLRMLPVVIRWMNLSTAAYVAGYRNPILREALTLMVGDPRMSALALMMNLALRSNHRTAGIVGGSRALAQAVANRYERLGGRVRRQTRVTEVVVVNGRATGVRCADGTLWRAAQVVSCADGRATIFEMLGGRFTSKLIRQFYERGELFAPLLQISLGINRLFPDAARAVNLPLAEPLAVDDLKRHSRMEVSVCGSDSALCPPGKTILLVRFASSFKYWSDLERHDPSHYRAEKERVLRAVIAALDRRFPGLAEQIECSDLATPATFARFTGNWQGSPQGWLPTPKNIRRPLPRTLPGLKDFYMAGQWIQPGGGLPAVALAARYVAQMICARDGKKFVATLG
jgi:phytoene dehydrogenase-like protein